MVPKIVIAQTHTDILESIERRLSDSGLDCVYTNHPVRALEAARDADVLVTGNLFYLQSNMSIPGFVAVVCTPYLSRNMHELNEQEFGDLREGPVLALQARQAKPDLVTLRYSGISGPTQHFCGDVYKMGQPTSLTNLLTDERFVQAVQEKRKELLPQLESGQWYLDHFPEDWQ